VEDITPKKIIIFLACCVLFMVAMVLLPFVGQHWF